MYRAQFAKEGVLPCGAADFVYGRYRRAAESADTLEGEPELERSMKRMFRLNTDWFMQTLLDRKDRCGMFSGLEVRVPFCDHRIVEYMYNVPWEYKDYKGREKGLLRRALSGLLPDEVLWRKKSPYPKTHNPGYRQAVSQLLREIISNPNSPLLDVVKKEELEKLLAEDHRAPCPWYGQLMTEPQTMAYFVQLNYWLKRYSVLLSTKNQTDKGGAFFAAKIQSQGDTTGSLP
jgi:asparagine synthase (glutamine-hydrolysing)